VRLRLCNKSSPKLLGQSASLPSGQRMHSSPLHVLAVQGPLQTNLVTQPWVWAGHSGLVRAAGEKPPSVRLSRQPP